MTTSLIGQRIGCQIMMCGKAGGYVVEASLIGNLFDLVVSAGTQHFAEQFIVSFAPRKFQGCKIGGADDEIRMRFKGFCQIFLFFSRCFGHITVKPEKFKA